jgi:2-methylisocitrate lyase-like PEP mutase family enzyme
MNDTSAYAARRRDFRALHQQGCFLLPNPWDVGGAVRLERLGYKAIASSSSACALALGRSDYQVSLAEALDHLRMLVGATSLPVNADFEDGFAAEPERVADNVRAAIATGIAGVSIEDRAGDALHGGTRAVERVAAARQAITDSGQDVLLVARTEAFLQGHTDPRPVIERLQEFAAAGADCLYAPGVKEMDTIRAIVRAVAPRPVNVLLYGQQMQVGELAAAGVRRVSLGGALAGAAWRAFDAAAKQFMEHGTLQPRA